MAGLNHTGPMGQGAMTGRKMGKCTNFGASKNDFADETRQGNPNIIGEGHGMGRGLGRAQSGRGMGMGRKNRNRNGD